MTLRELAVAGDLAQLADKGAAALDTYDPAKWAAEAKLDGWRIIAVIDEDGVSLYARSGNAYTDRLPNLVAELGERFPVGTVLDGEVVALDLDASGNIKGKWGKVQSILTTQGGHPDVDKISFVVFDLIAHGGHDARKLPYSNRRKLLEQIFSDPFKNLRLSEAADPGEESHASFLARGFEGTVLKRKDAPYASGQRGHGWVKVKPTETIEAVVMGFKEGKNSLKGLIGSIRFGQYDADGKLVEISACSGMDMRTRIEISKNREAWTGRVIEVVVEPGVGEAPRFSRYGRERKDKLPEQCLVS